MPSWRDARPIACACKAWRARKRRNDWPSRWSRGGSPWKTPKPQASQALKLADARAREAELARKEAELAAAVAADSAGGDASPPPSRQSGNRTIYTLPGSAFASGSARLTATAQASLQRMAKAVGGQKSVRVEAHTDSQGADAANLALSQQRADAVRQVLLAAGLSSARVKATGKGESDPLTSNGTAEGRARNRRVEMIVE